MRILVPTAGNVILLAVILCETDALASGKVAPTNNQLGCNKGAQTATSAQCCANIGTGTLSTADIFHSPSLRIAVIISLAACIITFLICRTFEKIEEVRAKET